MEIVEAQKQDVEQLVDELWFPLAEEMEQKSQFNSLGDRPDIRAAAIEHKREKVEDSDSQVFIAWEDGEAAGYIMTGLEERPPIFEISTKCSVNEIFVKKEFRRQGVATMLMDAVEEFGRERGCKFIQLEVDIQNESAQEFYERYGFEVQRKKMVKQL